MNTTAKLINWKEHGDMIILECELNGKRFEISTYQHINNEYIMHTFYQLTFIFV